MAFVTRKEWGAVATTGRRFVDPSRRSEVFIHWNGGPLKIVTHAQCLVAVKGMQRYHISKGWVDIGYNFLVCPHGDVIEGRGEDYSGAHCVDHNVTGYGIQIMCGQGEHGTDIQLSEARALVERLDIDVENRGVGGSLLHNAWPSIPNRLMIGDAVDAAIAEWGANVPDAVVLAGGANDMIEHRADAPYPADPQSQEHPRWALVHIMWRLQAAGVSNIYFLTLTPRAEGTLTDAWPTWPGILQERTASFNAWLRAGFPTTVIDTRGHFGDVRSGLGNTAFYVGDGLHPNALGHRVIGDRVASFLRGRL